MFVLVYDGADFCSSLRNGKVQFQIQPLYVLGGLLTVAKSDQSLDKGPSFEKSNSGIHFGAYLSLLGQSARVKYNISKRGGHFLVQRNTWNLFAWTYSGLFNSGRWQCLVQFELGKLYEKEMNTGYRIIRRSLFQEYQKGVAENFDRSFEYIYRAGYDFQRSELLNGLGNVGKCGLTTVTALLPIEIVMIRLLIEADAYDGVKDKFDIIFDFHLRILFRRKRISLPLVSISS